MRLTQLRAALAAATIVLVIPPWGTSAAAPGAAEPSNVPVQGGPRVTLVTGDVAELTTQPNGTERARLVGGPSDNVGAHGFTQHGDAYLVPASAQPMLAQDRLDLELFNVSRLVEEGYDDGVPVIVDYRETRGMAPDRSLPAPDGTEGAEPLPSIGAVAAETVAEDGDEFWSDVSSGASLEKVWLDAPVEATLDQSAAAIGAPPAWERGLTGEGVRVAVLDSGIDVAHPDFADRIAATADFTGDGSVADLAGHGTHVASTAAGSGAASDGKYRGIASDADLLVGKVLGGDGTGSMSAVIEGMEWAAANGADVVNLSLGGPVTNGDDPMSQAVDELTDEHGTLFVVAAGNHERDNPGMSFVTSPASAESALAVGALRTPESLWDSSRKARMDGDAIKPEITAPGFMIMAAGSSDAGLPTYVNASGTSMAAPHVAGAAALLKQRHPEWGAEELRDALTSTAAPIDPGRSAYEQGAGRVDVDRATRQDVYVDQGVLHLGYFGRPYGDLVTARTLTYRNESDAAVDLELATEVRAERADTIPDGVLAVRPATLHLEPGESRAVQVELDARAVEPDTYSGYVTATAGDVVVRTAVGFSKQDDMIDLTLRARDRHGRPGYATVRIAPYKKLDGRYYDGRIYYLDPQQTEYTIRLPEGDYNVWSLVTTFDESGETIEEQTFVGDPRLPVRAPNFEITLDAREAVPVEVDTPRPSTTTYLTMNWWRGQPGTVLYGEDHWSWQLGDEDGPKRISVTPTEKVDDAPFGLLTSVVAESPPTKRGYAYDLSFSERGRVPVDMSYRVRPGDLATVETTVYGTGTGEKGWLLHQSQYADCDCSAPEIASFLPETGLTRTEYLTAGDELDTIGAWQYLYNFPGDLLFSRAPLTYEPREKYREEWLKAPFSPGVAQSAIRAFGRSHVSTRNDDRLYYTFAELTDAAGHWTPFFSPATVASRVFMDGELIHQSSSALFGTVTVPKQQATYRIEADVEHDGTRVGLSTRTSSAWTFRSAQTPESQPLPLIDVDYVDVRTPGSGRSVLDETNAAPRGAKVELALAATHQEGSVAPDVRTMTVEVSYDDGATWQEASVEGSHGTFVASYRHAEAGDHVSLRIQARDDAGGRLDQTLIRAYRLR